MFGAYVFEIYRKCYISLQYRNASRNRNIR